MEANEIRSLMFALGGEPLEFVVDAETAERVERECSLTLGGWVAFDDVVGASHKYRTKYYAGRTVTTVEHREALGALNAAADGDIKRGEMAYKRNRPYNPDDADD